MALIGMLQALSSIPFFIVDPNSGVLCHEKEHEIPAGSSAIYTDKTQVMRLKHRDVVFREVNLLDSGLVGARTFILDRHYRRRVCPRHFFPVR
jgi:hypothetical protein